MRDLHLSHDVSVRFRLSSGTLREFVVAAVGFGVDVGVEVDVGFDVMGAVGIIMAATSDWRGGSGPRRRRALEARGRVNRAMRLQPSGGYQTQGLITTTVRRGPRARPLFGSRKLNSAPSRGSPECIGDLQLAAGTWGYSCPRFCHVPPILRLLSRHIYIYPGRAMHTFGGTRGLFSTSSY